MTVYIVYLQGQGDTSIKVLDQEAWDWLNKPGGGLGRSSWDDPYVPASQLRQMEKANGKYYTGKVELTSGSWENDRAMAAESIAGYEEIGYGSTLKEAMDAIKANGDELGDTYEGYIY